MTRKLLFGLFCLFTFGLNFSVAQCPSCGNNLPDPGETNINCPQDVPHAATCTSPCAQPDAFETTAGIRQSFDFVGTTTYSQTGLPAGWTFASGPSGTTSSTLAAAGSDAYGAKAGLVHPNCSVSCTITNGFCIGNLANSSSVFSGGTGGKLGANFDGRPNINQNLSYAVLRGQGNPTIVSPTFNMSSVEGFKVQFWLFPSETSCGQLNSWGSCVGNAAFLDFSTNGGTTWSQVMTMNLSSSSSNMCFNNSSNTLWLNESSWSRVCLTVFRSNTSAGNFYPAASATTAASGMMVNSSFFTSSFKFRIRYSQTASCTSGITSTNPGRYLAIDYPVITSGNEMIPCGISFSNMCGYGADNNDDGVGSNSSTSMTTVFGTTRRSPNHAERGVEIFTSQNGSYAAQNLTGSSFTTNFDLCNAEGGDKQCIDWQSNNNFYNVVYECVADWEAASGTGINVQYYKGTTPQSVGMTKVTSAGKTANIGWRYTASRFVSCSSLSDLNPGCNGYQFLSGSLPTQFSRGFYQLAVNSLGQSWSFYGSTSCSNYFNGPFFAPIAIPDTLLGAGNYVICNGSNNLVFTGLSSFCSSGSGFSGGASLLVTGPNGFSEVITSGGQGSTSVVDPGTYVVTAQLPNSPAQCIDCGRVACITITAQDILDCTTPVAIPGLRFWGDFVDGKGVVLNWNMLRDEEAQNFLVQRKEENQSWKNLERFLSVPNFGDYQFIDESFAIGKRSYRLQIITANGEIDYSQEVEITIAAEELIQLFPNPAKNRVELRIAIPNSNYSARLLDLRGKILRKWQLDSQASSLDLSGIQAGIYFLEVGVAGQKQIQKLIIE